MKPPERLLDASGEEGRIARRVFDDDGFGEPTPGAKERVWHRSRVRSELLRRPAVVVRALWAPRSS